MDTENTFNTQLSELLEEAVITPIDFSIRIAKESRRIFRLLGKKGWSKIGNKPDSMWISIGYATTNKESGDALLSILTFPNPDVLDETISLKKSFVPIITLTKFTLVDGVWTRVQKVFPVDNAKTVRKPFNNAMEHAVIDAYAHEENVTNGWINVQWDALSRKITTFKKSKPKVIK